MSYKNFARKYSKEFMVYSTARRATLDLEEGLEMIQEYTTEPMPRIPVPAAKAQTMIPARPYLQEQEEQEYYDRCQRQWEVLQEERRQDSCPFSFDTEFGKVDLGYYEEVYGA